MGGIAALEHIGRIFDPDFLKQAEQSIGDPLPETVRDFQFITLEDVRFAYAGETGFSIETGQFSIKAGEILFITGGNGSGKSTFINILMGLYPPGSGVIKIDGSPVNMMDYRNMFSTVFSDFHLFDRFYGLDTVDEHQVNDLLRLTELERKTRYEKGSFTTLDLSAGQQKRLALVVAMLEDKPVFVFDEWAANQNRAALKKYTGF
ncbi:MAG: ATP-binding cassette domain-containing protein [Desulfobacteraceae bacterium]|nr:ATP-binding cassette domain-containing protein [Desulfobacteraceae bacterium]